MIAKILAHFGQVDEAEAIYERITTEVPDNQDLFLDYAYVMASAGRAEKARMVTDRAMALGPESRRFLR